MIEPRSHIPILHVPKPKKAKNGIRKVSPKRIKLNREYSKLRKKVLAKHPICQLWLAENNLEESGIAHLYKRIGDTSVFTGHELRVRFRAPFSTDVHHKRGRGRFLLDTSTWMAVSREGHNWIHAHPKESYEKGYMLKR